MILLYSFKSITPEYVRNLNSDLWTMSPPCQPYTRNGNMMDLDDPRTKAMKHTLFLISQYNLINILYNIVYTE